MKTLIVYYSFTGNTKKIAEEIAKKIDGDLAEIILTDSYSGTDEQINKQTEDEVKNKLTPEILPLKVSLDSYEIIVIGTPVWWLDIPPAIRSFLTKYDLKGKHLKVFITHGGNPGETQNSICTLCPEIETIETFEFNQGKVNDITKLQTYLTSLDK